MKWFPFLVLIACAASHPVEAADPEDNPLDEAAAFIKSLANYIPCPDQRFIYGVGYIDGSYTERIFFADDSGDSPQLEVQMREGLPDGVTADADIPPLPFVLEIRVGRVLQAVPVGGAWQLDGTGWSSALRFKYTSWFGEVSRTGGEWSSSWSGYRRPMLPENLVADPGAACELFVETG